MEATEQKKLSSSEKKELKFRVLKVADDLPSDYKDIICLLEPTFDTPEGKRLLQNVKVVAATDENVTNIFEFVGHEYQDWLKDLKIKYGLRKHQQSLKEQGFIGEDKQAS